MESIVSSVGKNSKNNFKDVVTVQTLINGCIHLLKPLDLLNPDGNVGKKTIEAIELFQQNVVKMVKPDGRIDSGGKTIQLLNQKYVANNKPATEELKISAGIKFPLKTRSPSSYKSGMRKYGSNRANGRKHAGCDLYAPIGTPVYAMDDGEVVNFYAFYLGTYALEIKHPDFVARYGEIGRSATGIKNGSKVKKGQLIGYVGELKGLNMSMLHLELYSGNASGPLTVRGNKPYQRRKDLIDPTPILDKAI
ncbi:MAG TPA: M23 family metallopeptidase [Cellvibrio sp.]|nr:M23 family metallopeptidase [Cellvibrio sp.]